MQTHLTGGLGSRLPEVGELRALAATVAASCGGHFEDRHSDEEEPVHVALARVDRALAGILTDRPATEQLESALGDAAKLMPA